MHINKLYIINGIARSGNHLFIQWLLEGLSYQGGESTWHARTQNIPMRTQHISRAKIMYLNNIKYQHYFKGSKQTKVPHCTSKQCNWRKIRGTCIANNTRKLNVQARSRLMSIREYQEVLGVRRTSRHRARSSFSIDTLVITVENKNMDVYRRILDEIPHVDKVYRVLCIRDIVSLFGSRLTSDKEIARIHRPLKGGLYLTDEITAELWKEHYLAATSINRPSQPVDATSINRPSQPVDAIPVHNDLTVFNYNRFVLNRGVRIALHHMLDMPYVPKLDVNMFGFKAGSSFGTKASKTIIYFIRWVAMRDHPLMKYILTDETILRWLADTFELKITLEREDPTQLHKLEVGKLKPIFTSYEDVELYISEHTQPDTRVLSRVPAR